MLVNSKLQFYVYNKDLRIKIVTEIVKLNMTLSNKMIKVV